MVVLGAEGVETAEICALKIFWMQSNGFKLGECGCGGHVQTVSVVSEKRGGGRG
jgi:hypothetical protein